MWGRGLDGADRGGNHRRVLLVSRCRILGWPRSILPKSRAHREDSCYPKPWTANGLKAGRSLKRAEDPLQATTPKSSISQGKMKTTDKRVEGSRGLRPRLLFFAGPWSLVPGPSS